jgi:uncharacterized damage-inducible protein DinB
MSSNPVADNFLAYAVKRLRDLHHDIDRCLDKLSEDQIWHRGADHENSIANLLLHLEGNIRQWILHGIGNQPDVRRRDDEFTLSPTTTSTVARTNFATTLSEASQVIASVDPDSLLQVIDPQPTGTWRNTTILEAISKVVGHVEYHTGQIILLTKQMAAADLDLTMPRKR